MHVGSKGNYCIQVYAAPPRLPEEISAGIVTVATLQIDKTFLLLRKESKGTS